MQSLRLLSECANICVCFLLIYPCMCVFYTSFQTLASIHVWLPAPAERHPGVHSWKSKVQRWCNAFYLQTNIINSSVSFCIFFLLSPFPLSEGGGATVTKNHDENELPGSPSKPQVTDVSKNSVSLSWQPGVAGASPVSSFVIEAFRSASPETLTPSLVNSE